jgi:hypothetical protein
MYLFEHALALGVVDTRERHSVSKVVLRDEIRRSATTEPRKNRFP